MVIFQTLLIVGITFLLCFPEMSDQKIVDFSSDNSLFHPFVQKMRNYRSKDYLIKLLKRNLQEKLRKNRKLYDDSKWESQDRDNPKLGKNKCGCNCKCGRNFGKRCENCEKTGHSEENRFKPFVCESRGCFGDPDSCQKFYACFHSEMDPIEVICPKGFAFDDEEGKCTRKAARQCQKKHMSIYKN